VHGLFADDADAVLVKEGARVVTANTVPHESNAIDVTALVATGIRELTA
jgi:ribose-phosphate pyrophosphokinase